MKNVTLGAIAVLLSAGMAMAAVTKLTEFETWSPAESGDVDGVTTLKFENGRQRTHVVVVVHNLTPGQAYDVVVGSDSGTAILSATANNGGNLSVQGDTPSGVNIDGPNAFVALTVGTEVRVVGFAN